MFLKHTLFHFFFSLDKLLVLWYNFVTDYFEIESMMCSFVSELDATENSSASMEPHLKDGFYVLLTIREVLWNFSDSSHTFSVKLSETGLFKVSLAYIWVTTSVKRGYGISELLHFFLQRLFSMLYLTIKCLNADLGFWQNVNLEKKPALFCHFSRAFVTDYTQCIMTTPKFV